MPFRQYAERVADGCQRDTNTLRNLNDRHRAQDVAPVAPLIARVALAVDQPFAFIKVQRGDGHAGSFCHFAGRQQHFDAG